MDREVDRGHRGVDGVDREVDGDIEEWIGRWMGDRLVDLGRVGEQRAI